MLRARHKASILLLGAALAAQSAAAQQPFTATPEPDPVLALERGGFELPNGVQLAMTVQSQTVVDGHVVLRSVFHLDQGAPTLNVFAPKVGESGPAAQSAGGSAPGASAPGVSVSLDRTTGMVSVQPSWGSGAGPGSVSVTNGSVPAGSATDSQLPQVNLAGGPQQTGAGTVSVDPLGGGSVVKLAGDQIDVSHIFGPAFGSVITNTGNNRNIDTVTSIDLDLRNATPALVGSSMVRAEGLAIDATRAMLR